MKNFKKLSEWIHITLISYKNLSKAHSKLDQLGFFVHLCKYSYVADIFE